MTLTEVQERHDRDARGVRRDVTVDLASLTPEEPVLHLPGFLDPDTARGLAAAFADLQLSPYTVTVGSEEGAAYYFGANLYDARPVATESVDRYEQYFANAAADRTRFDEVVAAAELPHPLVDLIVPLIERSLGRVVVVASEGGRPYYTPVVRSTANGIHHHNDDGPREAPELSIGQVVSQRSILLYLDTPGDGSGQLEVFHKRPTDHDRAHNRRVDHGYAVAATEGVGSTVITPGVGDLAVFDAWNIHRVLPSTEGTTRVTVSTFYGELPDGTVIIWS